MWYPGSGWYLIVSIPHSCHFSNLSHGMIYLWANAQYFGTYRLIGQQAFTFTRYGRTRSRRIRPNLKTLALLGTSAYVFIIGYRILVCWPISCADPEGGGVDRGSGPPLKRKHKNIGVPSNIGPDPLKNHKATKPAIIGMTV